MPQVGLGMAVPRGLATLQAAAPRRAPGTPGRRRLTPMARVFAEHSG